MNTTPLWLHTVAPSTYPALDTSLDVDVLIVGGGVTGLTAGCLLRKSGRSVALVEKGRIGTSETGHTTAHLTYVTDMRLDELHRKFGRDHAGAVWDAGLSAIHQIRTLVAQAGIACELRSVPGFLVAAANADQKKERKQLMEETELANELGFDVSFLEHCPFTERPAMRVPNQAKIHPAKYVQGLAAEFVKLGGKLFEKTTAEGFANDPPRATANGHEVRYRHIFYATHIPLQGTRNTLSAALLQTKIASYSTYAIGASLPSGSMPEVLWWDTADPYHYLRIDRHEDGDILVFGGEDHKTGQEKETEAIYASLERKLRDFAPDAKVEYHWSGQVVETADGLPYIGEVGDGQILATGFGGNGFTFGTIAAVMTHDIVLGIKNPWTDLFDPNRKKLSSAWDYLAENKDYPLYLIKGGLQRAEEGGVNSLAAGEGKILKVDNKKTAAHKDKKGKVTLLSPICPHLGCSVAWNEAEQTWDCPCHGSRFTCTGELMAGPAEKGLERHVKE